MGPSRRGGGERWIWGLNKTSIPTRNYEIKDNSLPVEYVPAVHVMQAENPGKYNNTFSLHRNNTSRHTVDYLSLSL